MVVFHQFLAVTEVAGGVGVGDYRNVSILDGITGPFRSLNVGLADIQVINMDSARLGGIGKRHQFTNR